MEMQAATEAQRKRARTLRSYSPVSTDSIAFPRAMVMKMMRNQKTILSKREGELQRRTALQTPLYTELCGRGRVGWTAEVAQSEETQLTYGTFPTI